MALEEFLDRCGGYFEDGCVIDQPFRARLGEGVVRCYMAGNRSAGFGHQKVRALVDAPAARASAGSRVYTSNAERRFQRLRRLMAGEVDAATRLPAKHPPARSADHLGRGLHARAARVFPIPDEASAEIARRACRAAADGQSAVAVRQSRVRPLGAAPGSVGVLVPVLTGPFTPPLEGVLVVLRPSSSPIRSFPPCRSSPMRHRRCPLEPGHSVWPSSEKRSDLAPESESPSCRIAAARKPRC